MRGPFKPQAFEILKERGVEINTILDVGVLDGTPELIAAWPNAHHVLFEPIVEFIPGMRAKYAGHSHEIVSVAVAQTSGPVKMQVFEVIGDGISHSSIVSHTPSDHVTRDIAGISLDDWFAANNPPGPILLKIDIDGHEMSALRGASRMLSRCSIVIVEAWSDELPARIQFIQDAGFTLFDLAEPCYYDNYFWQVDAILVRSDVHQRHFLPFTPETFVEEKYTMFKGH